MFGNIRDNKLTKYVSFYLAINILMEVISPSVALALTSGPAQEEFASFEPASTSDMVELYSGDFNYNIPLLSVPGPNGGYPINIAYHSGIGMEQEASWVGLGWTLNVGAINRQLRGLPDDFAGDQIKKTQHMRTVVTTGLDIPSSSSVYKETMGLPPSSQNGFSNNWQVYYNNFRGLGVKYSFSPKISKGSKESAPANLDISIDSQNGIGVGLSFRVSEIFKNTKFNAGFDLGLSYHSRSGLESVNFSSSLKGPGRSGFSNTKGRSDEGLEKRKATASLSFNTSFGVPAVTMETKSTTVPFNLKLGSASSLFKFKSTFPAMWSGYVYTSMVANKGAETYSSYGYMNTNGSNSDDAMKDFSRESFVYSKKSPHLPTSSFTYDLFSQTGQGTGSMFRPYLNTFGVLSEPRKTSKDKTINAGLEVGAGTSGVTTSIHVGVDFQLGGGTNSSGMWTQIKNNPDISNELQTLRNWSSSNSNIDYEPYYFQVYGEKSGFYENEDQLKNLGGDAAVRLKLEKEKHDNSWLNRHFKATNQLISSETGPTVATLDGVNQTKQTGRRTKRSTSIEALTFSQASQYGFSKYLSKGNHPGHHIAEISVLQADGMRYVYGLPAYNNYQVDNVFSVNANGNFNTPDVNIAQGSIGGIDVSSTYEEYLSKNETPAYAHSWMLTTVLSSDYLDLTGDGPTDDDYGYWVKFNYEKTSGDFKWKVPYTKANFMEGYRDNPTDDKGSYSYGTKEIYFIKSIETKTHIAEFITSDRRDGVEAPGEYNNSGIGSAHMKKLDKIKLYTKREYAKGTSAVPTKVVNLEYTYDLCPGVPNNDLAQETKTYMDENGTTSTFNINQKHGKLTLKKIFFTYENSTRGALSPYVFDYGNINSTKDNPSYDKRNMDRWGNFKNNSGVYSGGTNTYPFIDFPYTDQDDIYYNSSNSNSLSPAQWSLKKIFLPTGGTLKIQYDFDDYSSVENKRPTRMFDIAGLGEDPPLLGGNGSVGVQTSATRNSSPAFAPTEARVVGGGPDDDNRIHFKLEKPIANTASALGDFFNQYIAGLPDNQVYFKAYVNLKDQYWDYVQGYAEIDTRGGMYGLSDPNNTGQFTHGYITLKPLPLAKVNITGIKVNPITRAGIEHLSANRSELIHNFASPYSNNAAAQIGNLLGSFITLSGDLTSTMFGFNNWAFAKNFGKTIQLNGLSVIRLCEPDNQKIGGGIRVKKITLDDNWLNNPATPNNPNNDADPNNNNAVYGQEYFYDTNGDGTGTTTGVAYEPQLGSEESSLKTPINYKVSTPLKGDKHLFMENPIMESYYPGASVGYAKVTVRSIAPERAEQESSGANHLNYSAAPITVNEFYTPKDFPVLFDKTDMNPGQPIRIPLIIPGVFSGVRKRQAKSQGYSVILNDMAGRQKSIRVLTRNGNHQISRQDFIYNTVDPYKEGVANALSSKVQVVAVNNNYQTVYQTGIIGQSHDMFVDMHEDDQQHKSFGLNLNLDIQYTPPTVFAFFIMPLPVISTAHNNMRTAVVNKIIHRSGIMMKTIVTTEESTITTENMAFDIETGEPVLTKTTNEFKDPIYNFTYPGHWYYNSMKGSYNNFNLSIDPTGNTTILSNASNGSIPVGAYLPSGSKVTDYFTKGDLLYIDCVNNTFDGQYHVFSLNPTNNSLHCINAFGEYFPNNEGIYSIKVIKSGFKNLQNTKVGSLTFKNLSGFLPYNSFDHNNSTNGDQPSSQNLNVGLVSNNIINAAATEYDDNWQIFCTDVEPPKDTTCRLVQTSFANDYISVINNLLSAGLFQSTNKVLYDNTGITPLFNYGFTQVMADFRPQAYAGQTVNKVLYTGYFDPSGTGFTTVLQYYNNSTLVFYHQLSSGVSNVNNLVAIHGFGVTYYNNPSDKCSAPNRALKVYMDVNSANGINLENQEGYENVSIPPYLNYAGGFLTFNSSLTVNYSCGIKTGQPLNPYMVGMKGQWRPKATYAFKTGRTQNNNVREDGIFNDFARFPWENTATKDSRWINAATITKYSPYGFELENKDAVGNYSSALYGYKHSLAIAVSANAKYTELAFDNFEDYPLDCNEKHFKFINNYTDVTSVTAHTGQYSLKVLNGTNASVQKNISGNCVFAGVNDDYQSYINNPTSQTYNGKNVAHIVNTCDCIGEFAPEAGKKYVISAWVKQTSSSNTSWTDYTAPKIQIKINGVVSFVFAAKGNIIDGWQQIFDSFTVPASATTITVELVNTNTAGDITYFDDIRLHPFDANMVSYVYDPVSLKTLAELDANNFATIYVYDDEGHLNKVKKETVEGIKTIKEGRINNKKINE